MLQPKTSLLKNEINEKMKNENTHTKVSKEKLAMDVFRNKQIEEAGSYENYIKNIYGLKHGKGKRRKKK